MSLSRRTPIYPGDPCRVVAQLSVGAEGAVRLAYDSSAFPDGIPVDEDTNLAQLRPGVGRCPARRRRPRSVRHNPAAAGASASAAASSRGKGSVPNGKPK